MATEADEVEVLAQLQANSLAKGAFAQNVYMEKDALEVRAGFGQIGQFDTTLRAPPSRLVGTEAQMGPTEILGSFAFVTGFGHVQHLTLSRAMSCVAETGDYHNSYVPLYLLHIFDATARVWREEVLHIHTSEYNPAALRMDKWRGYFNSNRDRVYGTAEASTPTTAEHDKPDNPDDRAFFCQYNGSVYFGTPRMGLWVYLPTQFAGPRPQQLETSRHLEWASQHGESACCFRVSAATGAFSDAYAYLDSAGYPRPVDVCVLGNVLAIADDTNVYFSDPGQPSAIIGVNILPIPCSERITAICEFNGQLAISAGLEAFVYVPQIGASLAASGTLRKVSGDRGCISAQAKCRTPGGMVWVGNKGVYRWDGGLEIAEVAESLKPLWTEQVSNPLTSYLRTNGSIDGSVPQPRSFYDMTDTRGVNCAYELANDMLLISIPGQNFALCLQNDSKSLWTFDSVVRAPYGKLGLANFVRGVFFAEADSRLFAVGGVEVYTPADVTTNGRGPDPTNDPSGSIYLMEWGIGGALDRSVDAAEDNRQICGWYEVTETGDHGDSEGIVYLGRPVQLPAGYKGTRTGPAAVGANDYILCIPVYLKPANGAGLQLPDKIWVRFTFDKLRWKPLLVGATSELDFWLPPERIASYEGWGYGAPIAGTAEIQLYDTGTGAPSTTGNEVRATFDGSSSTPGAFYTRPYMNLAPNTENPLFYIAFKRQSTLSTTLSQGIVPTMARTQRDAFLAKNCSTFVWREGWINDRHGDDDVVQAIDWCIKSPQLGLDKPWQVKTRGLFIQALSRGKGLQSRLRLFPYALLNATASVDWKDWAAQMIDYTPPMNGDTFAQKDPMLRRRFMAGTSTVPTQGVLDSTDANPPKFSDAAQSSKGNYLIGDEQFDTVAVSDDTRGEYFSWMVFGFLRDKAERLAIKSIKATMRVVAGRRRGGR